MTTPTSKLDHKEVPTGSPIFAFLNLVDRRWRLWIDALALARDGVSSPAELHALLLAHVAQQQARAALTGDQALALELLGTGEALLKHRPAALAFCAGVIAQVAARATDEPTEWVPS